MVEGINTTKNTKGGLGILKTEMIDDITRKIILQGSQRWDSSSHRDKNDDAKKN